MSVALGKSPRAYARISGTPLFQILDPPLWVGSACFVFHPLTLVDFTQGFIQGGGRRGTPFENSPPPLNQHKYYKESINSSKVAAVAAKRYAPIKRTPRIFPKVYSSCQNIGNRHCFLVGVGGE